MLLISISLCADIRHIPVSVFLAIDNLQSDFTRPIVEILSSIKSATAFSRDFFVPFHFTNVNKLLGALISITFIKLILDYSRLKFFTDVPTTL